MSTPEETKAATATLEDEKTVTVNTEKAAAPSDSSDSEDDNTPAHLHAKTWLAVLAVCLIYFAQLVNLVGAGAQGQAIAGHFNGTAKVVWFSAPITILTVVLGPIVSQAADYWGRKWFLVIFTLFGAVGSIIVARASSMDMAIAGFTVIGIAYGTQPLLHVVTSEVLPRRWRGYAQAADMISNSLGSVMGLLVGAALNRKNDPASNGFRYYYYMTMAIFAVAALLCALVYNPPATDRQKHLTTAEKLGKLDWVGYALLAAGLVLFCLGLSYFKNPYEFGNAHVAATFAVGLAFALLLAGYETWVKKDGMFHHDLFRNRNFAVSVFCVFSEGVAFFAANIYFAFQVGVLYETDAVLTVTRYALMLIVAMIAAVATGWYCAVTRRIRWITVIAFLIFVAFFVCMATTTRETNKPVWGYPVLLGAALGMTLTTLVTAAQLSTPPELIAIASGTVISVRSLGGTVGIAIYNALFSEKMSHLGENIAKVVIPDGLSPDNVGQFIGALTSRNETALGLVPGVTPQIIQDGATALLDTYVGAFRNVWIAAACFVGLAAIIAAFLFDPKKEFNMHIDAPMEKEDSDGSSA